MVGPLTSQTGNREEQERHVACDDGSGASVRGSPGRCTVKRVRYHWPVVVESLHNASGEQSLLMMMESVVIRILLLRCLGLTLLRVHANNTFFKGGKTSVQHMVRLTHINEGLHCDTGSRKGRQRKRTR
jgi:hypothetical protein